MEENVALDSEKQKKFVKSIRGIKKLIKKNDSKAETAKNNEQGEAKKPFSMRLKGGKINKKKRRKERGLVYLSHIPHGFYEHQMTQYFKQFGVVTNARVIRSKRTGNSKGCAFVEFKEPAVGQIVADTMNNYLMGKRLIKAAYIPPEKQKRAFRKNWNSVNNPTSVLRLQSKKEFNTDKDEAGELKRASRLMSNLNTTKKKLSEMGVNYDSFAPVDVPEGLLDDLVKQENEENNVQEAMQPKQAKIGGQDKTDNKKEGKGKKNGKNDADNKKKENANERKRVQQRKKKEKAMVLINEKVQRDKEEKLKKAGVKPPQFIRLDSTSCEESDGSVEYDKLLDKGSHGSKVSFASDEEGVEGSDTYDDAVSDSRTSESDSFDDDDDEEVPRKKAKGKPQTKKAVQKKPKKRQDAKRKMPRRQDASPRKAKYEKQGQKPMKRAYKKKK